MNRKKLIPAALMVYIAAIMALVNACKKDPIPEPNPTPTPNVPTDTITPVVPNDTITPGDTIVPEPPVPGDTIVPTPGDTIIPTPPDIPWDTVILPIKRDNIGGGIIYPTVDTIQKLTALRKVVILKWYVPPNLTSGWTPSSFRSPRDSLKMRFAVSDKVFGSGRINVNKNYGGASIPCEDSLNMSKLGMTECDSAIFAGWGYEPWRDPGSKSRAKQINFINTIGMNRAILGRKQH